MSKKKHTAVVVFLLHPRKEELAIIYHGKRKGYEALAGHIEPCEDICAAAARELAEEAGLAARELMQVCSVPRARTDSFCAVLFGVATHARIQSSEEGNVEWRSPAYLLRKDATFRDENARVLDLLTDDGKRTLTQVSAGMGSRAESRSR